MVDTLRIATTNDYVGRVDPEATTYGRLPGAAALHKFATENRPDLWLDAGDFAGWSPLASLSDATDAFAAAATLPFDLAVPGNHELDWGTAPLKRFVATTPFPVICANAELDLPPTHRFETAVGAVGVIGLTMLELGESPVGPLVTEHARNLRESGCRLVIVLVHDGVTWRSRGTAPDGALPDPTVFIDRNRAWLDAADLIIGGHTLARWHGRVSADHQTPLIQPWAFGAEVSTVEISFRSGSSRPSLAVDTHRLRPAASWRGAGTDRMRAARMQEVGRLTKAATSGFDGTHSLPDLLATAMLYATDADSALLPAVFCTTQPALDGVYAWQPAGPFTEFDIHRLVPYPHDGLHVGHIDPDEWIHLLAAATPTGLPGALPRPHHAAWWDGYPAPPGRALRCLTPRSLCATSTFTKAIDGLLQRDVSWRAADSSMKQAIRQLFADRTELDPTTL